MISILLPCYNSERLLGQFVRHSVIKVPHEIILYDNGNNGNISAFEGRFRHIIGTGENVGLNKALNACAAKAKFDLFFTPHTDMILLPDWDVQLLRQAQKFTPSTFLFCSRSVERTQGHTPFHIIKDFGSISDSGNERLDFDALRAFAEGYKDKGIVTGYRMPYFMHRALWDKMGGVDENYFSYATDNDLFLTAYDVGVRRFWMINGSLVYHMQGKSNAKQSVDRDSDAPYAYFRKKWAAKGYGTHLHIDALEQKLIPWNVKIA